MEISAAKTAGPDPVIGRRAVVRLVRVAVVAIVVLLLAVALLLATRRLSGALQTPLGTPALLAVGSLLALVAASVRGLWQIAAPSRQAWADWLLRLGPSLAGGLTAASVSLQGSPPVGLAGCWLLVVGAELAYWRPWESPALSRSPAREATDRDETSVASETLPANVVQRLTRSRDAAGRDVIDGSLRADLAADQRTTAVHVAFCPPFAGLPQVAVQQTAGPEARIKLAQVLPYGTRLDVRLTHRSQVPSSVILGINVRGPQSE